MIHMAICVMQSGNFPGLDQMFIPWLAEVENLQDPSFILENIDFWPMMEHMEHYPICSDIRALIQKVTE
jgi:hypothetical protein